VPGDSRIILCSTTCAACESLKLWTCCLRWTGGDGPKRRADGQQKRVNVLLSSGAKFDATGSGEGREVGRGAGYFGSVGGGGEAAGVRRRSQLEMSATSRIATMSRVSARNNMIRLLELLTAGLRQGPLRRQAPSHRSRSCSLDSALATWTLCACLFRRCGPRRSTLSPSTSHHRHICTGHTPSPETLGC
jgi:hypothetical protein